MRCHFTQGWTELIQPQMLLFRTVSAENTLQIPQNLRAAGRQLTDKRMPLELIAHLIPQIWVVDEEAALQGHCLGEGQQRGSREKFLENPGSIHRLVPKQTSPY